MMAQQSDHPEPLEERYSRWLKEYRSPLYKVVVARGVPRSDAEDLIHDVFVTTLQKGVFPDDEMAFFYRIVTHRAIDYLRKHTGERRRRAERAYRYRCSMRDDQTRKEAERRDMWQIVDTLSPSVRDVITTCYLGDISIAEYSRRTGISYSRAKRLHAEGMHILREKLSDA